MTPAPAVPPDARGRAAGDAWSLALAAAASLLPHVQALWPAHSYYFRDFTVTFYPLRLLQARELLAGRWPAWNPYVQEGSFLLPALYPSDLLQVLWPGPVFVSWLLTLQSHRHLRTIRRPRALSAPALAGAAG